MKTLLISYDLNKPGQDYTRLIEGIKSYPDWCKIHKSVWAVRTTRNATEVHRHLFPLMDANDLLFVSGLTDEAAWNGLPVEVSNWLQQKLVA